MPSNGNSHQNKEDTIVIAGAGIVGLVTALAINKHVPGIKVEIYEQARFFQSGLGAGIGMYPNGLRVIRDISQDLLQEIQDNGLPYLIRRWERHDGTEVVTAEESVIAEDNLQPMGIRRWKLQKILFDAVRAAKIPIHFRKKVEQVQKLTNGNIRVTFADATRLDTRLLLATDGAKSVIRTTVASSKSQLEYTGTTCFYGTAEIAREERGICFPSSETTKCHGCFYPTGPNEQCFQFHMPTEPPKDGSEEKISWTSLLKGVHKDDCRELADTLKADGWDEKYLQPLYHAEQAIKVPFALLKPPLETFVYGRIVLMGDSAHPPVPYLGQGAQQGLEDAGTLAMLLRHVCLDRSNETFSWTHIKVALKLYNRLRVPRTTEIIHKHSLGMGKLQQNRTKSARHNGVLEERIKRDVFFNETVAAIVPGVSYNYKEEVKRAVDEEPLLPVAEET